LAALHEWPELASWAADHSDDQLLDYADSICKELDETDHDRYSYIYADDTEARWMGTFALDKTQLWFWRQVATEHICPSYYPLTLGN
jgi:hypothetical protein